MILAEKAEALREEADSLSTAPVDSSVLWSMRHVSIIVVVFSLWLTAHLQTVLKLLSILLNVTNVLAPFVCYFRWNGSKSFGSRMKRRSLCSYGIKPTQQHDNRSCSMHQAG